jgi:hypothetical protein
MFVSFARTCTVYKHTFTCILFYCDISTGEVIVVHLFFELGPVVVFAPAYTFRVCERESSSSPSVCFWVFVSLDYSHCKCLVTLSSNMKKPISHNSWQIRILCWGVVGVATLSVSLSLSLSLSLALSLSLS